MIHSESNTVGVVSSESYVGRTDLPLRHDEGDRFALIGKECIEQAGSRLVKGILRWGIIGAICGVTIGCIQVMSGLLDFDDPAWIYVVWCLLAMYVLVGGIVSAYMAAVRTMARLLVEVGIKQGFIVYLMDGLLIRVAEIQSGLNRVDLEEHDIERTVRSEIAAHHWERIIVKAVARYIRFDDDQMIVDQVPIRRPVTSRFKDFLIERIGWYLVLIVRQILEDHPRAQVSMVALIDLGVDRMDPFFQEFAARMGSKGLRLGITILAVLYTLPMFIAAFN